MYSCKEILRLTSLGFSQRQIAIQLRISRNTVAKVMTAAGPMSLDWTRVMQMEDNELQNLLFPVVTDESIALQPKPDFV